MNKINLKVKKEKSNQAEIILQYFTIFEIYYQRNLRPMYKDCANAPIDKISKFNHTN